MRNAYDILEERGLVKQCSHPEELRELMGKEKLTFYIGFDPTADSLHIGHYVALMTMAHMQRAGHRPIVLLGGGTAYIGDPSGKTDMRRMMTTEEIQHNASCFQKQMAHVLNFEGENAAIIENNASWLHSLNFLAEAFAQKAGYRGFARSGAARNANGHNIVHVLSLRAENAAFDILYHILRNIKRTAL